MSSTDGNSPGFQKLVEVAANHLGMGTEFQAIRICHQARHIIQRHLPDLAGSYRVISFKNGFLNISAENSAILQKLQIKSHLIQEELNQWLKRMEKSETIQRIRLRQA